METIISKLLVTMLVVGMTSDINNKDFQGKAYYSSKSSLELGNWGSRMSESQKNQIKERLKGRLEKTYILNFNIEESIFKEEEKLDAISGATDSWGKNFTQGEQYKNIKTNSLVQDQEFYGKRFLVKDKLQEIQWTMTSEQKQIGAYTCFKSTASVPTHELTWYSFSWDRLGNSQSTSKDDETGEVVEKAVPMTEIVAWYTPQIPVSHGPSGYWGLPGLILEVSAGDTTMLCTKIIMNSEEKIDIVAPNKGKEVTRKMYQETLTKKMKEMREMYSGRRNRRS